MPPDRLTSWRRRIVAVCFVTYACHYLGRVNLAVTVPALREAYGWDKAAIGVIGTAFYWAYAAGQLINGPLGDRVSPRRVVAVGLVASALLNVAFGSIGGALPWLVVLWALNGWAQACGWAPIIRTLSRWFAPEQRARVTAFIGPSYLVGHAASWALAGALTARYGWRYAYWVPGALMLAAAALWHALARDEPDDAPAKGARAPTRGAPPALAGLSAVWRGSMRWAAVVSLLSGMVKEGLNLWGPTYLVEEQSLGVLGAALGGLLIPAMGIVGQVVTGRVQQRVAQGQERPIVAGLGVVVALGAGALFVVAGRGSLVVALGTLAVVAAGSHGMNSLLMASLPLSLGSRAPVSAVTGALNFCQYLGAGLGAALVGGLVDRWGWAAAYGCWVACALLIAVAAGRVPGVNPPATPDGSPCGGSGDRPGGCRGVNPPATPDGSPCGAQGPPRQGQGSGVARRFSAGQGLRDRPGGCRGVNPPAIPDGSPCGAQGTAPAGAEG